MSKADKAMSDIDAASSPGFPLKDQSAGFIPHARYGSETPTAHMDDNKTSHGSHAGFMDPVAQHVKLSNEKKRHVRNTALEEAEANMGNPKTPPYQHGDPEY